MFIIFSGVSGSGKQTVIGELMKIYSNSAFLKSATTRPPRNITGEHQYYHMSEKEFQNKINNNEFFETEKTHGFYYGILKSSIDTLLNNPQTIYMKDVDVHGTEKLMKALKDKMQIVCIFLEVPDDELFDRLIKRGESKERALIRISRGTMEREYKDKYDYVIENNNLAKTVEKCKKIIDELMTERK